MRLALLGDIALIGNYNINNNVDLLEKLEGVSEYLSSFDYVVGNLESPFSVKKRKYGAKSAYICTDVENAVVLKALHLDAVTLANNHIFDYGKEGYNTTISILNKCGIDYFGVDGKDLVVERDGNKILFSGYCCYSTNPINVANRYGAKGVNHFNFEETKRILQEKSNEGYLNVFSIHAGTEHVNYPHIDSIKASRQLADVAPYIYYGHHPHVIQGLENRMGGVIVHSLGNFCFDDLLAEGVSIPQVVLSDNNRKGMVLEVEIVNNIIVSCSTKQVIIQNDGTLVIRDNVDSIDKYNEAIAKAEDGFGKYMSDRCQIINAYYSRRKRNRNFAWYLKRITPRYAKLLVDSYFNKKNYQKNVRRYL